MVRVRAISRPRGLLREGEPEILGKTARRTLENVRHFQAAKLRRGCSEVYPAAIECGMTLNYLLFYNGF